jgi:hypothetical protein
VIRNKAGEIADGLRAGWPAWDIWLIYPAVGGITWCARLRDESAPAINASSSGGLEELLAEQRAER